MEEQTVWGQKAAVYISKIDTVAKLKNVSVKGYEDTLVEK